MTKRLHKAHHERKDDLPRWVVGAVIGLIALIAVAAVLLLGGSKEEAHTEKKATPNFTPVAGMPRLAVDQDMLDYGDVKFNTLVNASFRLYNIGDQPLRVTRQPQVEVVEGC